MEVLRVHSLHALAYCERLFYLEEVENLRVADASVFAGRTLHVELERDEDGDWQKLDLESETLGLRGRVDCLRRRDGRLIPYEHKRGRSARGLEGEPEAWPSDRLQLIAYCALVAEHSGQTISEGRIRYHADNVTVRVPIDELAYDDLRRATDRARWLQSSIERPAVTSNERLCVKCSLAPVCLPEEARLGDSVSQRNEDVTMDTETETDDDDIDNLALRLDRSVIYRESDSAMAPSAFRGQVDDGDSLRTPVPARIAHSPLRLFPADDDRTTLHVMKQGAQVGRSGDRLKITARDEADQLRPINEIGQVVLHGFSQITTQALRLCAEHAVSVHWVTMGGSYLGAWSAGAGSVQRRIRQYRALTDDDFCLRLARRLAEARARGQLSFLLRASRDAGRDTAEVREAIGGIRRLLSPLLRAEGRDSLRGYEGSIGAHYFSALPHLVKPEAGEAMKPDGRSRRPPRDRCNALLSFGYGLLLRDVASAIITVGLDPSLGFYHQPRSQAYPLALDLMELFRVPLVDLPVIASINRRQWDESEDFTIAGPQVWLSESGRKKFISLYEQRKADKWKHPVIGYSLSYARLIELEVRLLEKEWMNEGGLFARFRLR
jgi:CRISPR-associated protein Cas1